MPVGDSELLEHLKLLHEGRLEGTGLQFSQRMPNASFDLLHSIGVMMTDDVYQGVIDSDGGAAHQ